MGFGLVFWGCFGGSRAFRVQGFWEGLGCIGFRVSGSFSLRSSVVSLGCWGPGGVRPSGLSK